jgi:hypothetical protein
MRFRELERKMLGLPERMAALPSDRITVAV